MKKQSVRKKQKAEAETRVEDLGDLEIQEEVFAEESEEEEEQVLTEEESMEAGEETPAVYADSSSDEGEMKIRETGLRLERSGSTAI